MNPNMAEEERMSPDLMGGMGSDPHQSSHSPSPEEPRDLSFKRKVGSFSFVLCATASTNNG